MKRKRFRDKFVAIIGHFVVEKHKLKLGATYE